MRWQAHTSVNPVFVEAFLCEGPGLVEAEDADLAGHGDAPEVHTEGIRERQKREVEERVGEERQREERGRG